MHDPTSDPGFCLSTQNSLPDNPFPPIKSAHCHDPLIAPLSCSVSAARRVV
jgi:hypothetical protein